VALTSWRTKFGVAAPLILAVLLTAPAAAQTQPADSGQLTHLYLRLTGAPTDATVRGLLAGVDAQGRGVPDLASRGLQASLDGQPVDVRLAPDRPSLSIAVALLLDSSAAPAVRTALAGAIATGLQEVDTRRDAVAIVSTSDRRGWDQAAFTTSADDLRRSLEAVVQASPQDDLVSLDQVSGLQRALAAQSQEVKVLLLITNRPAASAATAATNLAALRAAAVDQHIQIGVLALPGAGGQGLAEALAEATPGGGVEYALNATNQADLTQRVSSLLAPALAARRFELSAPGEGAHTLSLTATGLPARTQATFTVTARAVGIAAIQAGGASLRPASQIDRPSWLTVQTADDTQLEGIEWGLDGRLSQVSVAPFAVLLDPDQLGEGAHDITARALVQGRAGPLFTTTVYIPFDVARLVRRAVRDWGLPAAVLLVNGVIAFVLVRALANRRGGDTRTGALRNEFQPVLSLKPRPGGFLAPEVIEFPARGKLRIGYHPPYMDNHVGTPEFQRLPYQDIRGDEEAVKDLSRHAACVWRDPETNDCYIQLGWPAPGEPVRPKAQAQVLHFGKPQDATNQAFRLSHQDVVRLASSVEYVFNQLGLRDKPTPERKKIDAFASTQGGSSASRLAVLGRGGEDDTATGDGNRAAGHDER
jgi:hypothetical protein